MEFVFFHTNTNQLCSHLDVLAEVRSTCSHTCNAETLSSLQKESWTRLSYYSLSISGVLQSLVKFFARTILLHRFLFEKSNDWPKSTINVSKDCIENGMDRSSSPLLILRQLQLQNLKASARVSFPYLFDGLRWNRAATQCESPNSFLEML